MEEKISVIVPVYNVEKYIEKCIKSISEQTYKKIEIILVDDGSTDSSGKICDEWEKKDKRIVVIHKINGGLSDARNCGIEKSTGKYLLFVDSDDYIENNMIEILYNQIKNTNSQISCCGFIYEENENKEKYYGKSVYVENSEQILKRIFNDNDISSAIWDKLYKKELFDEIKFPVGKIHEDMGTLYKLIHKAEVICHINNCLYHYVQRENSILHKKFNEKQLSVVDLKEEIYLFVCENYFYIANESQRYFIQQLNKSIILCCKNELKDEYHKYKNVLKKYFFKECKNNKISIRTKLKSLLILMNCSKYM